MKKLVSCLSLALAMSLGSLSACGTTPGRAIAFAVEVAGADLPPFVTSTGWQVTLEEASISLGPVYVYAPEPAPVVALSRALVPLARAHGGTDPFGQRELRAEILEQHPIDALDGAPQPLGIAVGSEGDSSDLVLALAPPHAPSDASHGRTLWIAGLAEKDGALVPFEGGLDFPDEGLARFVEGVPIAAHMDSLGTLRIELHVERWLDQAHFDRLEMRGGDRATITDGDQVSLAWRLGARHPDAYGARWIAGEAR